MLLGPFALALLVPCQAAPGDWPCWRGANHDGLSSGPGWSAQGETKWTAEVGLGYSSPSIVQGRLYVNGFERARGVDVVRCLQTQNGLELWRQEHPARIFDQDHGGGTLTTPTVDGERLYVSEREGRLACYEAGTGRVLWLKELAPLYDVDPGRYGFSGSPLVAGELLIMNADRVFAFDKRDGDLVWSTDSLEAVYATPLPFALDATPCVAILGQRALDLVELAHGTRLRTFPWQKHKDVVCAASPIANGARLLISSAYDHGCALLDFEGGSARAVWANRALRSKMAGGILLGAYVYGFDESMLVCLDLAGEVRWRVRGLGNGALSGGDGKLAVLSSQGELLVAEASPEGFVERARAKLLDGGDCWTPPVIAHGFVYCRNSLGTLVCRDHRELGRARAAEPAFPTAALPDAVEPFARHSALVLPEGGVPTSLRLSGTFEMSSQGYVPVPLVLDWLAPDRWHLTHADSPPRQIRHERVFDGEFVFHYDPLGAELPDEAGQRAARDEGELFPFAELTRLHAAARSTGHATFFDRDCQRVEARTRAGTTRTLYFDVESGLLRGREAADEPLVVYDDYHEFDGLLLPALQRRFAPGTGIEERWRITKVERVPVDPCTFARPDFVRRLVESGGAPAPAR